MAVTNYIDRNLKDGRICKTDIAAIHTNAWGLFLENYFPEPDELDQTWIEAGLAVPRLMRKRGFKAFPESYEGTPWSELKLIQLVKELAEQLGRPTYMPKQKELPQSYRGAVSRFGGQSRIAEKAGLTYQGQAVGEDGRVYWTDDRVIEALREVASAQGQPNMMPSQRAVKNFFAEDASIVTNMLGTQRKSAPRRSWADLAELAGLTFGKQSYIKKDIGFLRDFVASLGSHLDVMDASESISLSTAGGWQKPEKSLGVQ